MHVIALAWIFVVVLMALAEGTSPQGNWLGAFFTLLLYGALPLGIVLYVMGTPLRRRARLLAEQALPDGADGEHPDAAASVAAQGAIHPDNGRVPSGKPVAPERKEP